MTAVKGGSVLFIGKSFAYVVRFAIGIVLARFLGAEQFGLYSLTLTAMTMAASLAILGMVVTLVRYVSVFQSRQDAKGLWGTLQIGLGLPFLVSLVMGTALFVLAAPIAERLFHAPKLVPLLKLGSLALPFMVLNENTGAALRGFKNMRYAIIGEEVSHELIKLALIVLLAMVGLNAARAVGAHVLTAAIVSVILLRFLNKLFSLRRPLRTARRDTKSILNFALPVYFEGVIFTLRNSLQPLLLGTLYTVTHVGIYAVAERVTIIGMMINQSLLLSSMPLVSELHDQRNFKQMGRFYQTIAKWTFTLNLPLFLIILLFPEIILSVFGESYVDGAAVLVILAGANLVAAATGMCGVLIDMTGYTRLKVVNAIVEATLVFSLGFLLIPAWGMVGAAWATFGAVVMGNTLRLLEVFILFRLFPFNVSFVKPVIAGATALTAAMALDHVLPSEGSFARTAVYTAVLLGVYAGMIPLLRLSPEDRAVLDRFRGRVAAAFPRH